MCVFPHVHHFCMREGKGGAWESNPMQGNSRALNLAVESGPKKGLDFRGVGAHWWVSFQFEYALFRMTFSKRGMNGSYGGKIMCLCLLTVKKNYFFLSWEQLFVDFLRKKVILLTLKSFKQISNFIKTLYSTRKICPFFPGRRRTLKLVTSSWANRRTKSLQREEDHILYTGDRW